ncbi:hypothetical protein KKH23_03640 [Patescibacteria group bacterium]|nr:hypothetical protein [Patescibacteria group bacterium]MBU0846258.1 hypothetical protein [Patescibacteria group bacterium]MBU0922605.1 hypothetical protein [Patescibacteria group bacterium]MBU1066656.1 hypothetical protein [Patescibacteria group bacterium]MBU1845082.1 hypothetical protein [Patescibacteria group bacterium]
MTIGDQIKENFYRIASSLAPNPVVKRVIPEKLKNYHVVWDAETVEELSTGKKISRDNWARKKAKINGFYDDFLKGNIEKTQILVVKDLDNPTMLIVDGIHRSVGFYTAYLENPEIASKTDFTYKLFESNKIRKMYDYKRLFS